MTQITIDGLATLDVELKVSGRKSSEGDGRTAADIEREMAEAAAAELAELRLVNPEED